MITLYTPGTGFPDLEAKIAFGLARVGIEAFGPNGIKITPLCGIYKISIEGDMNTLVATFELLSKRILSSNYIPATTPGITGRSANSLQLDSNDKLGLARYNSFPTITIRNKKSEPVCHHTQTRVTKVSNVIGLAAPTSYHHSRDFINVQQDVYGIHRPTNPKEICKNCALLALLGTWFTTFIFSIKTQEIIITPLPKTRISGRRFLSLYSIQHQLRKTWHNQELPCHLIPIFFLSRIPSSSEILSNFDLFVAVLSRQQGYHVDGFLVTPVKTYFKYLSNNSFNPATVDIMFSRGALEALSALNRVLLFRQLSELHKFARLYLKETTPKDSNQVNLLYPETTKYLLKEVAMIKPEIIKNKAISSLAQTLRYFIREKKYHYADDLRNARKESKDFEETITKMLREGRLRFAQNEKIHLPNEEEIKEIFNLANEHFDEVKTAVVLLGLSFPSKGEEEITDKEVQDD